MLDDDALFRLRLPRRPESVSAARKALAALNGDLHLVSQGRLRDVQLMTSELVTNAIRHSHTHVSVVVHARETVLRVEVHNAGAAFDERASPSPRMSTRARGACASSNCWHTAGAPRRRRTKCKSGLNSTSHTARPHLRSSAKPHHRRNSHAEPAACKLRAVATSGSGSRIARISHPQARRRQLGRAALVASPRELNDVGVD